MIIMVSQDCIVMFVTLDSARLLPKRWWLKTCFFIKRLTINYPLTRDFVLLDVEEYSTAAWEKFTFLRQVVLGGTAEKKLVY